MFSLIWNGTLQHVRLLLPFYTIHCISMHSSPLPPVEQKWSWTISNLCAAILRRWRQSLADRAQQNQHVAVEGANAQKNVSERGSCWQKFWFPTGLFLCPPILSPYFMFELSSINKSVKTFISSEIPQKISHFLFSDVNFHFHNNLELCVVFRRGMRQHAGANTSRKNVLDC